MGVRSSPKNHFTTPISETPPKHYSDVFTDTIFTPNCHMLKFYVEVIHHPLTRTFETLHLNLYKILQTKVDGTFTQRFVYLYTMVQN